MPPGSRERRPTRTRAGAGCSTCSPSSQTSPSEAASRRELIVLLADALAGLPETEAEVLWLYHAEGLSFEAIGERLGAEPQVDPGDLGTRPEESEAVARGPPSAR